MIQNYNQAKRTYTAPSAELLEVQVEKRFAVTSEPLTRKYPWG